MEKKYFNIFILLLLIYGFSQVNMISITEEEQLSSASYPIPQIINTDLPNTENIRVQDTLRPVIFHTPIPYVIYILWPPTLACQVSDSSDWSGIDSVWVRWYKNNQTNEVIHFKLINTHSNYYSATFNRPMSYIFIGDSVKYKIFARDNSSNHNIDSTPLYAFQIVYTPAVCNGSNMIQASWPFNTYWHDSRTQMLYTANEITAAGGGSGNIFQIGFDIKTLASQSMQGFNIRMQNTFQTSLTNFINAGWTTVYSGPYTVPDTGLQYITLQSGFNWNGISNLLVEICFDNISYTSATIVSSTTKPQHCIEYHTDGATGCSLTSVNQVSRPNLCLKIQYYVGLTEINTELVQEYSLSQNYPNPFNPKTMIRFVIPMDSRLRENDNVVLNIYNSLGQIVETLVNEELNAGTYEIEFNGSNFASGVYYYSLVVGDNLIDTKKMVLVK